MASSVAEGVLKLLKLFQLTNFTVLPDTKVHHYESDEASERNKEEEEEKEEEEGRIEEVPTLKEESKKPNLLTTAATPTNGTQEEKGVCSESVIPSIVRPSEVEPSEEKHSNGQIPTKMTEDSKKDTPPAPNNKSPTPNSESPTPNKDDSTLQNSSHAANNSEDDMKERLHVDVTVHEDDHTPIINKEKEEGSVPEEPEIDQNTETTQQARVGTGREQLSNGGCVSPTATPTIASTAEVS